MTARTRTKPRFDARQRGWVGGGAGQTVTTRSAPDPTIPAAEASRERCARFVQDPTRARVVARNVPRGAAA